MKRLMKLSCQISLGGITVDVLTSVLTIVFDFVSVNFSKAALEPLWKFSLVSISFRLGRVRHVLRTFKYPNGGLLNVIQFLHSHKLPKMARMSSSSPSPGKLIEAKLLVARADGKAKSKKAKSAKSSNSKATAKQPDDTSSDLEVVEDCSEVGAIK